MATTDDLMNQIATAVAAARDDRAGNLRPDAKDVASVRAAFGDGNAGLIRAVRTYAAYEKIAAENIPNVATIPNNFKVDFSDKDHADALKSAQEFIDTKYKTWERYSNPKIIGAVANANAKDMLPDLLVDAALGTTSPVQGPIVMPGSLPQVVATNGQSLEALATGINNIYKVRATDQQKARAYDTYTTEFKKFLSANPVIPTGGEKVAPADKKDISGDLAKFDNMLANARIPLEKKKAINTLRDEFAKAAQNPDFNVDKEMQALTDLSNISARAFNTRYAEIQKNLTKLAENAGGMPPAAPKAGNKAPEAKADPNMQAFDDFIDQIRRPDAKAAINGLRNEFEKASKKASFDLPKQLQELEKLKNVNQRLLPAQINAYRSQLNGISRAPTGLDDIENTALVMASSTVKLPAADAGTAGLGVPNQGSPAGSIPTNKTVRT